MGTLTLGTLNMALRGTIVLLVALVALWAAPAAAHKPVFSGCKLPNCIIVDGKPVFCKNPNAFFEYVQHPTDCTKFFQCATFGPVEFDCPAGLGWNPSHKLCDFKYRIPTCNH